MLHKTVQAVECTADLIEVNLQAGLAERPLKSEETPRQMVMLRQHGKEMAL